MPAVMDAGHVGVCACHGSQMLAETAIHWLQLSPFNRKMCLSGGYDGKVFVTDCERVVSDQMSYRKHSRNIMYGPCGAVR